MLDAFIIEELRRREEQERDGAREQPRLELPLGEHVPLQSPRHDDEDEIGGSERGERGVVVIDL